MGQSNNDTGAQKNSLGVLTKYFIRGTPYTSYILGADIKQLKKAAAKRGLNERIESRIMDVQTVPDYSTLHEEEFISRLPEILHTACFLSFVALKAKTVTVEEILGDEGVVHELSHLLANIEGCNKKSLDCMRDLIRFLQRKAIGFYEPV